MNLNKRIKNFDWMDLGLTKWSMFAFTLMIAKIWPGILGLAWYWYGLIFVTLAIRPIYRYFR
jgi:hypothetical protein